MKLSDLGEFGFIARVASRYQSSHPAILKGIGDDAAVLSCAPQDAFLLTTDLLLEDIHFRLHTTTPYRLGWKSLAVNASDIAAMGGVPVGFTLSLGIPAQRISVEFLDQFYEGVNGLAKVVDAHLLGGDTSESDERFIISVSVLGTVQRGKEIYRGGGKDHDDVYVTGWPGEAAMGLRILEQGRRAEGLEPIVERHELPMPRVKEGNLLAKQNIAHAMIDVSDGVLADMNHLVTASGLGGEIDLALLPLSTALRDTAGRYQEDPMALALSGGEDYELLFSAAPDKREAVERVAQECGCPMTRIGRLSSAFEGIMLRHQQGRVQKIDPAGFDHFKRVKG